MVNKHRAFWSNMSDGAVKFGYTDKNFEKHMEAYKQRNKFIYDSLSDVLNTYPDKQREVFHEICEALRTLKDERGL